MQNFTEHTRCVFCPFHNISIFTWHYQRIFQVANYSMQFTSNHKSKRINVKMPDKLQTFLINIFVIEGRHYIWPNMNSTVIIKIDNQKKNTAVKNHTDCPYYNEYFVFEFSTTLEKLLDKNVIISVIKPGTILRKRKVLGYVTFDVGTVWYHKDHQFYHKWAILTAPREEFVGGTRGYLKLDVSVCAKGEIPKIPEDFNSDEIEGNLLLPYDYASGRQRVHFVLDIHRGIDFIKKQPLQENNVKKAEAPAALLIEMTFSGNKVRTSTKKHTSSPIWDERLVVSELFPPLCQRFKIELYHGDSNKKSVRYLNMRSIAYEKEEGFLPTFGPAFLHFYSPNDLEGYLGKVLMSLDTQCLSILAEHETKNRSILEAPIIEEEELLRYENVTLFAAFFEVSSISRKFSDKPISFRIACGANQKELDESGDKVMVTVTPPIKPKIANRNHCYLPIEENKPCLYTSLTLPDTRKRMYGQNLLTKMLRNLKSRLDKIEDIFNNKDYKIASFETESLLLETLDFITSSAEKYIDIVSSYNLKDDPVLDQQRQKVSLKEMENIILVTQYISDYSNKKRIFQKIEKIYSRIESLIVDIETWPLIYFWMIYGNKRVAYHLMKPENIIHSPVEEEKGLYCGSLQTIYFQTEEVHDVADFISMASKVDIIVWMGLERHWESFLQNLPPCFTPIPSTIPRTLLAEEKHEFQARVHVFQGRFTPGADRSGLCDPCVQVVINGHHRQTQTLKKILNPVWDQTLYFKQIVLYGSREFIVDNPPCVFLEIYDQDECYKLELVGKCVLRPIIKTLEEPYCAPKFPPKLSWHHVYNHYDVSAEILAIAELLELSQDLDDAPAPNEALIARIPPDIKPNLVNHRIEVVFWGVRSLKKLQMRQITKPKIVVEVVNDSIASDTLLNSSKNLNFDNPFKILDMVLPEQPEYAPPLSMKMFDCRNFGIHIFAGTHVVPMTRFLYEPMMDTERERRLMVVHSSSYQMGFPSSISAILRTIEENKKIEEDRKTEEEMEKKKKKKRNCYKVFNCFKPKKKKEEDKSSSIVFDDAEFVESDDFDWWTKFYASLDETPKFGKMSLCYKYKLKIYRSELESQPEFSGFTDYLQVFPLYKGKRTGDDSVDEENTIGIFKGTLKIYQWPLEGDYVTASGLPLDKGAFQDFPSNSPLRFVLRVYCVRALGLRPKDIDGKSDPYLYVTLNQQVINDKENCVKGQINPIFGRCFELTGVFPQDHTVSIAVYDWDAVTADDLIGETRIDLENRFYTKHRAHCGVAQDYLSSGYCRWRDQEKPSWILENLCRSSNIPEPEYTATSVKVASKEFYPDFVPSDNSDFDRQILALAVLKEWEKIPVIGCKLVPEHVETRSLYHPLKPGIEQGKLQLWIDILPIADLPTPRPVNITPRKPVAYELRAIIWNAEKIKMDEDDFFTGERKSDIFIKGWLTGSENAQFTDVHYRSLSGEGNFNWRFVFPFEYLSTENKIVLKEKTMFDEKETKIPCRLTLQSWDNDTFSAHDFLGVLCLELSRIPRGARTSKNCTLALLDPDAPVLNLFKIRRSRGWWPLKTVDTETDKEIFAGCLEVEFELLTQKDADKSPAGRGRNEPQALPMPNRPDTSFSWFRSPFKAIKFIMKQHKGKFIKMAIFVLLCFVVFGAFYALPGYSVKRLLGA